MFNYLLRQWYFSSNVESHGLNTVNDQILLIFQSFNSIYAIGNDTGKLV